MKITYTGFLTYILSIVYTFKVWGIGWGFLSILVPVFPLIDLGKMIALYH